VFTSYIFKFRVSPLLDKLILGFCNSTVVGTDLGLLLGFKEYTPKI